MIRICIRRIIIIIMLENYMCSGSCCIAVCYLSLVLVLNLIVRTAIKINKKIKAY